MIKFKTLRWKNMLSTGNYFIETKLDANPNTLIVGTNGSGKSTMLDALCFALFGKAFRNINKPTLLNSINNKDCLVEVEFEVGIKNFKVVRGIKPNIFQIYQDGVLLNQDAATKDYQEYLERFIIKLDFKSFTQIVILGSASFVPFMQLSAADRRAIIEDLLDIQIFSSMNSLVKARSSGNKDNMIIKKNELELVKQKYDIKKEHFDNTNQSIETRVKEYVDQIDNQKKGLQTLHESANVLGQQVQTLTVSVAEKNKVDAKIKSLRKIESQIEEKISKVGMDKHFFEHNEDCPTCRQAITVEFKEGEFQRLSSKELELSTGQRELQDKLKEQESLFDVLDQQEEKLYDLRTKLAVTNTSIIGVDNTINTLTKQLEHLQQEQIRDENAAKELEELAEEIKTVARELVVLAEEKSYFDAASVLLKDTGIKTKIIKQYLPVINKLVNMYLSSMDFFVNFNLDESFKETIKSRHRDDFSYHNFSEGEKQRIDMALMLTWRAVAKLKNSSSTNLLILDEVFDSSLDTTGTDKLMGILHSLEDVNLFVISHKGDILQDKFTNVIKFQKVKNFSKVVK